MGRLFKPRAAFEAALFLCLALGNGAALQIDARDAARLDAQGKCAESEPYYRRALAAGSPSAALLNNAGNHYLLCGEPEKARSHFERLLELDPAHANANLQLARIAAGRKQGAKALQYLVRVQDSSPPVRLLRAEACHWAGKRDEALAILAELEQQAGRDAALLAEVAAAFARLGHHARAETAWERLVRARPGDFDALLNLGRAAARAEHYDRARAVLEAALKIRPEDVDALVELGRAHAAAGDYSRAVYLLARARKNAPRRTDIVLLLARAAEDAGYYGDSALAYDEYLQRRPDDMLARRDRARVLGYTGTRLAEGLAEMAAYIAARPRDPVGHYNLAQFTWRTDPEKSLAQLAEAVRVDPNFAPAHVSRAWLLHRLGRGSEAVPHLRAALLVLPDDVRALDLLGLVYLSLEQPEQAAACLRRARAAAPDDPEVLLHLGRALVALGREEEAQPILEEYQRVRPRHHRDPRREPGMIESATLSDAQRRAREIERFRGMARSRPDDPLLQAHLAGLLLADGRVEEALSEFRRLLALNTDAAVWEQAGRSLLEAEQYELAREFLERAAAARPAARLDLAIALFHTAGPDAALQVIDKVPEPERAGDFLLVRARILDAAGRAREAQELLAGALPRAVLRPHVARQAALLLARDARYQDASDLLLRAIAAAPNNPDLLLAHAMVVALMDRGAAAEARLKEIQARWPEWDRPYLVLGLLAERAGRTAEAVRHFRLALTLGSQDLAARCALARMSSAAPPASPCGCPASLREWLFPGCSAR